ncbi:MAG: hypothetical protein ACREFB_14015 [Stellaceae bacterium]
MKHLLNGVAIAAVLAITAPAWAQKAPMTPAAPPPMAAPAPAMAKKPVMHHPMMHHPMMHHHMHMAWHHHWHRHHAGDTMTEQLNREELARITHGGGAMMPEPQMKAPEMGGPRPSPH